MTARGALPAGAGRYFRDSQRCILAGNRAITSGVGATVGSTTTNAIDGTGSGHVVEVFGNVMENNGTANVMIVGYRYPYKDEKYQPLPRAIVAAQGGDAGVCQKRQGGMHGGSFNTVMDDWNLGRFNRSEPDIYFLPCGCQRP